MSVPCRQRAVSSPCALRVRRAETATATVHAGCVRALCVCVRICMCIWLAQRQKDLGTPPLGVHLVLRYIKWSHAAALDYHAPWVTEIP